MFVVEDEKIVAADLQAHLQMLGYEVPAVVSSGEEALKRAGESHPDLVLMDIQLKGRMDGIEAARIFQTRLNIPVIYVTAFADDATFNRAKSTEPYGYVVKPFGRKELQTAVELALHKHGRERKVKTHEQWLMNVISHMGAAIITTDHTGLVCMMNPKAEEYTGVALGEALGAPWTDLISFPDAPDLRDTPISKAVRDKTVTEMLDTRVVFPRAGRRGAICGAVSSMGVQGSGGADRAAILVFRDISVWVQLENQYVRARHLEDMQRMAGGLAHQFSNLVTMISGYSESLARTIDPSDPRARDIRTIQKVTERASSLTRDLAAFSRGQTPTFRLMEANKAVAGVCEVVTGSLGSSMKLELGAEVAAARIDADPDQLQRILLALVSNARDAMPDGGTITVKTSRFDVDDLTATKFVDLAPGAYLRIDVCDTGVGMSYETQSHIFEPFFTTKPRSTGLGLAAVYGMVKQNHGHIWFESEPQKGSTFTVCLPRVDGQTRETVRLPQSLCGSETILVVDDDVEDRALIRDMLLDLGHRVIEAASGNEALKICEQQQGGVELVLSNVVMPNMTGMELARRLSNTGRSTPVLFMSKYSEYALRHHGALEQGTAMLQKPFAADILARAVREALRSNASASLPEELSGERSASAPNESRKRTN